MTKLTVVPCGGLANRINCIMSAWALLEHFDVEIQLFWENTPDCAADFNDLFRPVVTEKNLTIHNSTPYILKVAKKRNLFIPRLLRRMFYGYDAEYSGKKFSKLDLSEILSMDKKIYVYSSNRFTQYARVHTYSEIFHPTDEIENKIRCVTSRFGEYTCGVHVRRTDNQAAIKNNPIEKYINLMRKEIDENHSVKFYVASDSEKVKNLLREHFGDRIITEKWDLRRSSRQGIKDAIAEVFCLGRTKKIIGSTDSTYSSLAKKLYDIPIVF